MQLPKYEKIHKKPHGIYTKTVLWKHGVKSGSVVFHVKLISHIGLIQNVVNVSEFAISVYVLLFWGILNICLSV